MNQEIFLNNVKVFMAPIMTQAYPTEGYLFNLNILSNIHQIYIKNEEIHCQICLNNKLFSSLEY